jgi:hypothetical protein
MASEVPGTRSPTAEHWHRWRREIFGDPYIVWHDGPDFAALLDAARSDVHAVGRILAAGLQARDPLAAQAFGRLAADGLVPSDARELLRAAAATATDEFLIRLAEALFALTADRSWADPIVSVLATAESEFVRLEAAIALAGFPPSAPLVQAVARAVCDAEYLVRYHAANTLRRYAGVEGSISDDRELFARLTTPTTGAPADTDRLSWQSVADELSARVRA